MKRAAALALAISLSSFAFAQQPGSWSFAVSGDSRNCGDIVVPAIAQKVRADHAAFYWHLGDYRAFYDFDQDMEAAYHGKLSVLAYQNGAWQDFIDQQLASFGDLPVYLAIGNHELISKTRTELLVQFADWFDAPDIRAQRLLDNPADHALHGYFHWHVKNVDFITLDNASADQFDDKQVAWIEAVLKEDEADPGIRTIVVGMHDALPDSLSAGHSMNESPISTQTGRRVYNDIVQFKRHSGKEVQVLASHSHFVLSDPYKTSCRKSDDVLPGWIIGAAGATRYRLPKDHAASSFAQTDVYGYLLANVDPAGHVTFSFKPVNESDITPAAVKRYGKDTIHQCFVANNSPYTPDGPTCPTPATP